MLIEPTLHYVGRFAPSPTGPLHAGSLVAALASWLDARAQNGQWLVRMEDVDSARCVPGTGRVILQQLAACGLLPDQPPVWQSQRGTLYQLALDVLIKQGGAYACSCSRKDIEVALQHHTGLPDERHAELIYPGTCRAGTHKPAPHAWRLHTDFYASNTYQNPVDANDDAIKRIAKLMIHWTDRRLGPQHQDVQAEVGDFVLKRADSCFSYQLAVVVDDAAQGVTDVVRGEDLTNNTARQIWLQHALNLPTPYYLHVPLVRGANGEKLSKQNAAQAFDTTDPLASLNQAARTLGLSEQHGSIAEALALWVAQWPHLYNRLP